MFYGFQCTSPSLLCYILPVCFTLSRPVVNGAVFWTSLPRSQARLGVLTLCRQLAPVWGRSLRDGACVLSVQPCVLHVDVASLWSFQSGPLLFHFLAWLPGQTLPGQQQQPCRALAFRVRFRL